MKFAYIDNGLHSYDAFDPIGSNFYPLSIWELAKVNLCRFDALIIPFHTDQVALKKFQKRFKFYLKQGRMIASMTEKNLKLVEVLSGKEYENINSNSSFRVK